MRIISGTHKGRVITPPGNLRARPTTDFAKENLFNVLSHAVDLEGTSVLDLFSGTGSMSYEFVSRGASEVVSVEINRIHYDFIRNTAKKFGFTNLHVVNANAILYLKKTDKKFDIIFADPPYDLEGSEQIIEMIMNGNMLVRGGLMIFEHSGKHDFSSHPDIWDNRKYGSVHFSIFRK